MKFLIFSDLHRSPNFDAGTYEDLRFFEERAKREGCDFIIHGGDLCHGPTYKDNADFVRAYNELDIPTYHCIGNHDADHSTFEEVLVSHSCCLLKRRSSKASSESVPETASPS